MELTEILFLLTLSYSNRRSKPGSCRRDSYAHRQPSRPDSNTYQLTVTDNGNFCLGSAGASSAFSTSYENVTATDDVERIFHFYNDTMTTYGVTCFRLSYGDAIPKTAQPPSIIALDYDDNDATKPVFVAADLAGSFYYTVVCAIDGEYSKVFLVADIDAGVETLKKPELVYTVTGGVVSDCSYIVCASRG
jgi:hypothetical protein